ncbi:MAG: adenine phosphoribosyltransferase [Planctomycetes bacterium]|nr:adenine phosphoribosyltransferase [Planctomycetota bacterium]
MDLKEFIRDVPDFPKPGITFKDITPMLANHQAMAYCIESLRQSFADQHIDVVAGIESRGFIFAPPLAIALGCSFVPIRKPGKLPWKCRTVEYDLEYGSDRIEIHEDSINAGNKVLLVDDLLATGGTMRAAIQLINELQGDVISTAFIINLRFLGGEKTLGCPIHALIDYE